MSDKRNNSTATNKKCNLINQTYKKYYQKKLTLVNSNSRNHKIVEMNPEIKIEQRRLKKTNKKMITRNKNNQCSIHYSKIRILYFVRPKYLFKRI